MTWASAIAVLLSVCGRPLQSAASSTLQASDFENQGFSLMFLEYCTESSPSEFEEILEHQGFRLAWGDNNLSQDTCGIFSDSEIVQHDGLFGLSSGSFRVGAVVCLGEDEHGQQTTISPIIMQCDTTLGSNCEASILPEFGGFYVVGGLQYFVRLPSAKYCRGYTEDLSETGYITGGGICGHLGIDLLSLGISLDDGHGNSIAFAAEYGLGGGFEAGVNDGVFTFSIDFKFVIGLSFGFSVRVAPDCDDYLCDRDGILWCCRNNCGSALIGVSA